MRDDRDAVDLLRQELLDSDELPVIETDVPLPSGEVVHAAIEAHCWWYGEAGTTWNRYTFLSMTGPVMLGLTAAMSALGNHRRRRSAETLAAPQWRHLGYVPVLLTNRRLLVITPDDEQLSIPLPEITPHVLDPEATRLGLTTPLGPITLQDPWMPYLAAGLSVLTAG